MSPARLTLFLTISVTAGTFLGVNSSAFAAGLMSACQAEIAASCSDVSSGRGRISACLYANGEKLSGACKAEVDKISSSGSVKRNVPAGVLSLQGTEYEASLRKACTSDANKLCPGVKIGKARILSCLYSRANKVSGSCKSEAKRVLDQL